MTGITLELSVREICECEAVSENVVIAAVEHEIAAPLAGSSAADWVFDTVNVIWVRKAIHLHRDLDLDWVAIAMVIDLLRQRERLHKENRSLKQRLQRFTGDPEGD